MTTTMSAAAQSETKRRSRHITLAPPSQAPPIYLLRSSLVPHRRIRTSRHSIPVRGIPHAHTISGARVSLHSLPSRGHRLAPRRGRRLVPTLPSVQVSFKALTRVRTLPQDPVAHIRRRKRHRARKQQVHARRDVHAERGVDAARALEASCFGGA